MKRIKNTTICLLTFAILFTSVAFCNPVDVNAKAAVPKYTVEKSVLPSKYAGSKLSNSELKKLKTSDPLAAKKKISKIEDAEKWIKLNNFNWMDGNNWANSPNSMEYRLAPYPTAFYNEYTQYSGGIPMMGSNTIATLVAWLLQDDIPEIGVFYMLPKKVKSPDGYIWSKSPRSLLYIPQNDGSCYLISLDRDIPEGRVKAQPFIQNGNVILDFKKAIHVYDIKKFAEYLCKNDKSDNLEYSEAAIITDFETETYYYDIQEKCCTFQKKKGLKILYSSAGKLNIEDEIIKDMQPKKYDIKAYHCDKLGKLTLTKKNAQLLNKKSIKEAAKGVKTVSDLIQYMQEGGFIYGNCDIWQDDSERADLVWHFNQSAETVNNLKYGGCGGTANLVAYLLWGDYDEVGFVCHTYRNGEGGGHIYNYVKHKGKYYVFDLTDLTNNNFNPGSFQLLEMKSLKEYANRYQEKGFYYLPVIYSYNKMREIPIAWGKDWDGCSTTYFPTGSKVNVIKEDKKAGYSVGYTNLSKETAAELEKAKTNFQNNTENNRVYQAPEIKFPEALSGESFTYDKALTLAGKSLKEKAEAVKTVEDAMKLFKASGYRYGGKDRSVTGLNHNVWHFNHFAETAIKMPELGCGQTAAVLRYLLDGDYDEVGYVCTTWEKGQGGGHVFNYIRTNGKYYVIDFTLYTSEGYNPYIKGIIELDSMDEFKDRWQELYTTASMKAAYCYSNLREIPLSWPSTTDVLVTALPKKYEKNVHIIYQDNASGYSVKFTNLSDKFENAINKLR